MSADPGLQNGIGPSTSTIQVKSLWVYTDPLKLDASSLASRALNQDEICKSGQLT